MDLSGILNSGLIGIITISIYALTFLLPLSMGLYLLINFLTSPKRKQPNTKYNQPETKFAVIIPACNEEKVIVDTINLLKKLNYPNELYDIVIIADNCTDLTPSKAMSAGAIVLERNNDKEKSKAFALKWFFELDFLENGKYDAFCIVDADTILDKNFLNEVDREMVKGYSIVNGRSGSINPYDSFTGSFMTLLLSIQNRIWLLPQSNNDRSGFFAGTGVCIKVKCLREIGWNIHTLVEDAEFGIQAVLNGGFIKYCDHARFYVEQVGKFSQLWKQQRRWRTGHISCLKLYGRKLIKEVFKEKNKNAIAPLILVMIPPFCVLSLFQFFLAPIIMLLLFGSSFFSPTTIVITFIIQFILNFIVQSCILILDQRFSFHHWKGIFAIFFAPLFFGVVDITCIIKPIKEWDLMKHGETKYINRNPQKGEEK